MKTSIVIRSRDEAPRLRLTLASLEAQAGLHEVVVVDDGSADETPDVIAHAAASLSLRAIRHDVAQGRSAAANAGAAAASGALLIFLDGDTLAGPGMVTAHAIAHRAGANRIGRGETWHLRATRFLRDPETLLFWPQDAARGERLAEQEREAMRVTRDQVRNAFDSIARRASPGVYPGAAPRRLQEEEMRALAERPSSPMLWAAASGSNLSVPRELFRAAGGFDPALDINEHRELAYRLHARGARMMPVRAARSYHLTHRAGWRDPLAEQGWERAFRAAHPHAPLDALKHYWAMMAGGAALPDLFGG